MHLRSFVLLLAVMLGTWAHGETSPGPDPICGFIPGPYFYYESSEIRKGLSVDLEPGKANFGQPVVMRFFVTEKPGGSPRDDLQIDHEKLMHIIGMRADLSGFFHIHPKKVASGIWEVTRRFNAGGSYKIWADIKSRGISYSFGQPEIMIPGNVGSNRNAFVLTNRATTSGYEITFAHDTRLTAGTTNRLEFWIRDQAQKPVETENFLGSPMHLLIVKNDLSSYSHGHPESALSTPAAIRFHEILGLHSHPGNLVPRPMVIRFRQVFSKPGIYKLFAQFRPKNTKLPPEEALLAEFYFEVHDFVPGASHGNSDSPAP